MNAEVEQTPETNLNPVLSVKNDGTVIYSSEASEPILNEWGVRVGEKLPSSIVDIVQRVISRNSPEKIEVKVGNKVYLVVLSSIPEQECVNISGFDISDQKNLEERIQESEEKYRAIFENSIDAILLTTPDGNIQEANPAACQMFMMREDEIIRAGRSGIVDTSDPRLKSFLEKRARIGKLSGELNYRRKNDIIFPGEVSSAFFKDRNGIIRTATIVRDISERRQAEHQLSNELVRATGLYELFTRSSNLSDRELYDFALDQAVKITDSKIGFFHLVSEDEKEVILTTWNQEALRSCTAGNEGHYPIEEAGNWVDCVRLKWPVVYNDFSSSPNQKGLPNGHTTVKRFMSVPVTENGKVRIIFGVGNKVDEYDNRDVMQLQLVANELHKIMKLRRIENEVRENEAFLRDIMENVSDAIFVKDREARMILANPAYYKLMGKAPEKVLNKTAADFHPPEIAKKLAEDDKRVIETGKGTTLEERIFTSHGWRILQTVKAPYYDGQGNIIGLIGAARDITERKRAEEVLKNTYDSLEEKVKERTEELEKAYNSLKESEEKFRNIVETANEGIVVVDSKFNATYVNKKMTDLFGYSQEEIIGKSVMDFTDEEGKAIARLKQKKICQDTEETFEFKFIRKDGSPLWVLINSKLFFDKDGNFTGALRMLTDITESKKAEEVLAKIEITRKQEIHHRIKNNLQIISSMLDLQAEKLKNRKCINDCQMECIRNSEVLEAFRESQNRVISMALIHKELHKGGENGALNFSHYIKELTENLLLAYRLGNNGLCLNMDVEEDVFFDIDMSVPLGIIVNELVSNSLKHAFLDEEKGEIRIKLHRENGERNVDDCKSTTYILTVSDNGAGIPEDFDIKDIDSLGLQLVTALVDQLDGELELKRDNGTEFIIRFTVSERNNHPSEDSHPIS